MSKAGDSARALVAAGASGGLFVVFWLVVGVPLAFSAAAGVAAYAAAWFMLKEAFAGGGDKPLDTAFVDRKLAAETVVKGHAAAEALRALCTGFAKGRPAAQRFRRLAELLDAIAADVEADPKDAPAANSFIAFQGEAASRLARLALDLEARGASAEQKGQVEERLQKTLARMETAFEHHLARLQDDNVAELQAELDVLEQSLGWDEGLLEQLEADAAGHKSEPRKPQAGSPRTGTAGGSRP